MAGRSGVREPMDGLRGLAALGFAIGSWGALSIWRDVQGVKNLLLLADFVLLVAGFIVARAHRDQLNDWRRVARYVIARAGRLFPLHLATLCVFLAVDLAIHAAGGGTKTTDADGFAAHMALLQVFRDGGPAWNEPAWIVALEFHMSLLFGALCMLGLMVAPLGRVAAFVAIAAAVWLRMSPGAGLSPMADLLLRGAAAFMMGSMLYSFINSESVSRRLRRVKKRFGDVLELWAFGLTAAFIAVAPDQLGPLAPVVFWFCLLVFLRRTCFLGEGLRMAAPQRLGDLTYSILLTHFLLIHPLAGLAPRFGDAQAAAMVTVSGLLYAIAVIAIAEIALRVVEIPTRKAIWTWSDRALADGGLIARFAPRISR